MITVKFYRYDQVEDARLKFAVIMAKSRGKWVFCKHKERDTLEFPGGHREAGETVDEAAERELREETGAVEFEMRPVCVYAVIRDGGEESFGGLYEAEVSGFGEIDSEIEKIVLLDTPPEDGWTYPEIQPRLLAAAAGLDWVQGLGDE